MQDEPPGRSRQGTVTVLALLLSLLLGYAPAAAAAEADRGAVRLGKFEAGKAGAVLRSAGRLHSADADKDDLLAAVPPGVVVASLWIYPAQASPAAAGAAPRAPLTRAYRARAPPAA